MARPREFDRDAVLEQALQLFWSRGYEVTSMADLVEHLGVGRQSLYDTFGDKRALYLQALDRYKQAHCLPLPLLDGRPLRVGLQMLLTAVVDWLRDVTNGRGCMLVHAMTERGVDDPEVRARFCANTDAMVAQLEARLSTARTDGELGAHHDPRALARYLVNTMNGLQLSARAGLDRAALMQIVDVALMALG
jgi:TetR/AcrR family transcriptional repressor of nem operon